MSDRSTPATGSGAGHEDSPRLQRARSRNARRVGPQAPTRTMKRRIEVSCYAFVIPIALMAGRMVQLQAFSGSRAQAAGQPVFTKTQALPARRAQILAADGTALAVTLNEYNVCVNPRAVKAGEKAKLARILAETIGGDESKYLEGLARTTRADGRPNRYVRLATHVSEDRIDVLTKRMKPPKDEGRKARVIRKAFWSPVTLEASARRHYPLNNFAPQVIGFTGTKGGGRYGIERAWNDELAGKDGQVISQVDALDRPIPGFVSSRTPPIDGHAVVTTIDPEIQAAVDATLSELQKNFDPTFATAIVMRPATGEILGMATSPLFNLNKKPQDVAELVTDRCLTYNYEPGSTFKLITAAAAVESVPDWASRQVYVTGEEAVGKYKIHDWDWWSGRSKPGSKTLSEGIRDSSNITMWHFARDMGAPKMVEYAEKFGIGEDVDLGPVSTARGLLHRDTQNWSRAQLASFSFGQGLMLTPLQLVRAVGAIANDGVMMKPMLVKELRDEQGRAIRKFEPEAMRRVIQPSTAREVTAMMERVISEGTARKYVFVPGYRTAGKTGSAQKADGKRGYNNGKFISSLVGFVPANKPEYVILVMADEPKGSHWGSEVCGPAFDAIANKAMLHLRLQKGASAPAPDPALTERPKEKQKAFD